MKMSSEARQLHCSELRRHLVRASQIANQPWSGLGVEDDLYPHAVATSNIEAAAERLTSLILVRLFVIATPANTFKDLSTGTVCETLLQLSSLTAEIANMITEQVVTELRSFVTVMLKGYNNVPYHNFKHAYHVVLSSCSLMDMILKNATRSFTPPTSGSFEMDGLLQLALLFAALIHDTEHQGVPNAQLVLENHPLALQYNDQSIAEQRSLTIGFLELLQPRYDHLRDAMFQQESHAECYRRFRGAVTNLILATDIATPSRGKEVRERWASVFQRTQLDLDNTQKPSGRMPVLPPPREHPTPIRRPTNTATTLSSKVEAITKVTNRKSKRDSLENWIDCALTPSKHFPRHMAATSTHSSLALWWFSSDQSTSDNESVKSFSEDDDDAASFAPRELTTVEDQDEEDENVQLEGSISLLSDWDKGLCGEQSTFQDDFPAESKAAHSSFSSLTGSSNHHLLSKSRLFRSVGAFSRSPTASQGSKHEDSAAKYGSMSPRSYTSMDSKPRKILDAFAISTSKRKIKKADAKSSVPNENRDATCIIDCSSSSSTSPTADLTVTESSSADFPPPPMEDFVSFDLVDFPDIVNKEANDSNFEEAEGSLKSGDRVLEQELVDQNLRSLSLIEHILLVADVSHTMQSWDTMNIFAHRLCKEIMKAIKKGRSGGIKDDPLSDWYSNQSAFLHAYILPLAQRLEGTGTLPPAEDLGSSEGFLSSQIKKNLERWQDQGHDVIATWRREREERSTKKLSKKDLKPKNAKPKKNCRVEEGQRAKEIPSKSKEKRSSRTKSPKKVLQ